MIRASTVRSALLTNFELCDMVLLTISIVVRDLLNNRSLEITQIA